MPPSPTPNWFLAFPLPAAPGWHNAAAGAPAGLCRLHPADLHLTLAFLGPCGEERALAAWRAVAALGGGPRRVSAGGWRALGPAARPSAYGLTLAAGAEALTALLGRWGPRALAAAGLPPERRAPLPHITLLRPRRAEAEQWREPMARWMEQAPLPAAGADLVHLALYTWAADRRERLFQPVRQRLLIAE